MENKVFILLVGPSGSGKSMIAKELEKRGLSQVRSYTTRAPRFKGEDTHLFLKQQDIEKIKKRFPNRVAETIFDGHFYFGTTEQVEENDIYVIDPAGIEAFKQNYKGNKLVKIVYVTVAPFLLKARMMKRGDAPQDIERRIEQDKEIFAGCEDISDLHIRNYVLSESVNEVLAGIERWKKEGLNARKNKN